jgi:hypothetical protein
VGWRGVRCACLPRAGEAPAHPAAIPRSPAGVVRDSPAFLVIGEGPSGDRGPSHIYPAGTDLRGPFLGFTAAFPSSIRGRFPLVDGESENPDTGGCTALAPGAHSGLHSGRAGREGPMPNSRASPGPPERAPWCHDHQDVPQDLRQVNWMPSERRRARWARPSEISAPPRLSCGESKAKALQGIFFGLCPLSDVH